MIKMIIIDCIARAINRNASCIKTVKGVAGVKRTFSRTYAFNRALGS